MKKVGVAIQQKHYRIGYTQGTFDMLHVGHLNLIERAAQMCDVLFVGVNSDRLVEEYKGRRPVINEEDRSRMIAALKYVDSVLITETLDKSEIHKTLPFDAVFIGDDWKGNERWLATENELKEVGARVEYLPHTDGVSSTVLRPRIGLRVKG